MDSHRAGWLGGCTLLLCGLLGFAEAAPSIKISTPAFATGQPIPGECALKGGNISPALSLGNVPAKTRSVALVMDDPDAPSGLWTHWLVWNLPASTASLAEGALPSGAVQGKNSFGHLRYDGPAPPNGTHRYFIHVYALDTPLSLPPGSTRAALEQAMKGHIVGSGETFGTYSASH